MYYYKAHLNSSEEQLIFHLRLFHFDLCIKLTGSENDNVLGINWLCVQWGQI